MLENRVLSKTIEYIINFLLNRNQELRKYVQYVSEAELERVSSNTKKYVYIVRSDFFNDDIYGTQMSAPSIISGNGFTALYGSAGERIINENLIINADLIASAYYCLSRYEQYLYMDKRDCHNRFPAKESFLVKNELISKPIVDEYSDYLCRKLGELGYDITKSRTGIKKIYFTHDIDIPFEKHNGKIMLKKIGRALLKERRIIIYPFLNWLGIYSVNPRATWVYMLDKEAVLKQKHGEQAEESICFIVSLKQPDENSMAYIEDKKISGILQEMKIHGSTIGLHTSYRGAEKQKSIQTEKENLEEVLKEKVRFQRNHYLRQIRPMDMKWYENAGFTDDFTCGFNEVPGFMLGTTRPVKFINPEDGSLNDIILHSLNIMDGTLSGKKPYQLELTMEQAKEKCMQIIQETYRHGGELCLLWHNGMFEKKPGNYQKELYDWIVDYCDEMLETEKEVKNGDKEIS